MSKYQLNKALRALTFNADNGPRERYKADAAAFVAEYELTAEEQRALAEKDVSTLYAMGVQTFLLVPFAQWIWDCQFKSFQDLLVFQKTFSALVEPHGWPDTTT